VSFIAYTAVESIKPTERRGQLGYVHTDVCKMHPLAVPARHRLAASIWTSSSIIVSNGRRIMACTAASNWKRQRPLLA